MGLKEIIRLFLPYAKMIAQKTATPVDDLLIQGLELFLNILPENATKEQVANTMKQVGQMVANS